MINSAPRFAVVLSGCGVFDGSEIHEAVLTMLAIDEAGGEYRCFAPNTWQAKTVDHFTGQAIAWPEMTITAMFWRNLHVLRAEMSKIWRNLIPKSLMQLFFRAASEPL